MLFTVNMFKDQFRRQILQGFMNKRQVTVSDRSSNSMEMKEK